MLTSCRSHRLFVDQEGKARPAPGPPRWWLPTHVDRVAMCAGSGCMLLVGRWRIWKSRGPSPWAASLCFDMKPGRCVRGDSDSGGSEVGVHNTALVPEPSSYYIHRVVE